MAYFGVVGFWNKEAYMNLLLRKCLSMLHLLPLSKFLLKFVEDN